MSRSSVDDSESEEALSPADNHHDEPLQTEEQLLNDVELVKTTRDIDRSQALSTNFADEFGIAPDSPTRQLLKQSHGTTMDKLVKKTKMYGSRSSLQDLGVNRALFDGSWARDIAAEESSRALGYDSGDVSFLSKDGDPPRYSHLSMSTPDFAQLEDMPPPRTAQQFQSPLHPLQPTQALSEWDENPLAALIQASGTDDLPSTRPSSDEKGSHRHEMGDERNYDENHKPPTSAIEVAIETSNGRIDNRKHGHVSRDQPQVVDLSEDELASASIRSQKSIPSISKKRTLEDTEPYGKLKKRSRAMSDDHDIFAGLPTERYRPRTSRSRANPSEADEKWFRNVDFSKNPRDVRRDKSTKISRRRTDGDIVLGDATQDGSDEEEVLPAKRTVRKKTVSKREDIDENADVTSLTTQQNPPQASLATSGTRDAIVVGTAIDTTDHEDVSEAEEAEQPPKKTSKGKKATRAKRKTRGKAKSRSSQVNEDAVKLEISVEEPEMNIAGHIVDVAELDSTNLVKMESEEVVEGESKAKGRPLKRNAKISESSTQQESSQVAAQDSDMDDMDKATTTSRKNRGKGKAKSKKGGTSRKPAVEIVTLDSSMVEPRLEALDENQAHVSAAELTKTIDDDLHDEKPPEMPKPEPLTEKTNLNISTKQATPEKPEKGPTKHSPIKNSRIQYRVGLSRRTRIEPLLKIVRKEKEKPVANTGGKKKV